MILIGLVALLASQVLLPSVLVPALEVGSGLLVVVLGLRLLRLRLGEDPNPLASTRTALGVMVLAVGVNRTALGLGLIVSFSAGLAAVLMGIGLLLVRSRAIVARFGRLGTGWTTALPLVSAVIVTVLGVALAAKGLGSTALPL